MYSLLFSSNKLHLCTHVIANFSVFRVITHKELAPGIVTRISHNFEEAASGHYAPVSCLKINLLSQMLVINQGINNLTAFCYAWLLHKIEWCSNFSAL